MEWSFEASSGCAKSIGRHFDQNLNLMVPRYIEYYRYHTILFFEIKTNNLFTGGQ